MRNFVQSELVQSELDLLRTPEIKTSRRYSNPASASLGNSLPVWVSDSIWAKPCNIERKASEAVGTVSSGIPRDRRTAAPARMPIEAASVRDLFSDSLANQTAAYRLGNVRAYSLQAWANARMPSSPDATHHRVP